jgi:tetratricopeptide (TPR) repeat protein
MMRAVTLLLLVAAPALAQIDPDTEIARRHFERGTEHYDAGRYDEAVREFEAAREVRASPAFDYNIARCYDRLERVEEAIAAYRRYLSSGQSDEESAEAAARIAVLRERLARRAPTPPPTVAPPPPAAPPPPIAVTSSPPSKRRQWLGAGVALGAGGVAFLGAGLGLYLGVGPEYDRLSQTCAPSCAKDSWRGLQATEQAGIALLSIGGALVVADVIIWIAGRKALSRR